jgi:radical SAM/Cys-rich protein
VGQGTRASLQFRRSPLAEGEAQRALLDSFPLSREFDAALQGAALWPLRPDGLQILQVNVGRVCNQTCRHCHVDAGPDRREQMSREVMQACLALLDRCPIQTVDITGGAPEMHPDFQWFVAECRRRGRQVIDRCNLTILEVPRYAGMAEFLAGHSVEVVCSLPHYRALSTDRQRGEGVHAQSLRALERLNALGYGDGVSGRRLVLVTNPVGAFLPAGQAALEAEWKQALWRNHGIRFDALYALCNMPIGRFLEWLEESGNLPGYLQRLLAAFNPAAAAGVMCRTTLSVGWDGTLYDCDFNQMLDLPLAGGRLGHVRDFDLQAWSAREVRVGRHCFGCTAGAGSSCSGATGG